MGQFSVEIPPESGSVLSATQQSPHLAEPNRSPAPPQDRDTATGAVTCAANFTSVIPPIKMSQAFPDGVTNSAMDYKVEKTDDGQIYITVLQADRP